MSISSKYHLVPEENKTTEGHEFKYYFRTYRGPATSSLSDVGLERGDSIPGVTGSYVTGAKVWRSPNKGQAEGITIVAQVPRSFA